MLPPFLTRHAPNDVTEDMETKLRCSDAANELIDPLLLPDNRRKPFLPHPGRRPAVSLLSHLILFPYLSYENLIPAVDAASLPSKRLASL
jgi:hypothetical protein